MNGTFLSGYCRRINYDGPLEPTLEVLMHVQNHHLRSIPFENLDPLLGNSVSLALPDLEKKLIHGQRGGYCFEHNHLLQEALQLIGFQVESLIARVYWNAPEGTTPPRTHMLLKVCIQGEDYLCDAGFASLTVPRPIRLVPNTVQHTCLQSYRLRPVNDCLDLQIHVENTWRSLYRFDPHPAAPSDYDVANWYTATNPLSPFVSNLIAARLERNASHTLSNGRYTWRNSAGESVHRNLESIDEILSALKHIFQVGLPSPDRLRKRLQQLGWKERHSVRE